MARGVDRMAGGWSASLALSLSAILLVLGVVVWLANWVRRRLTTRAVGDVVLALRRDAFNASVNHDLSFYDEFSSGRIVSRITSDTQEFAQMVMLVTDLISQILEAVHPAAVLVRDRVALLTLAAG